MSLLLYLVFLLLVLIWEFESHKIKPFTHRERLCFFSGSSFYLRGKPTMVLHLPASYHRGTIPFLLQSPPFCPWNLSACSCPRSLAPAVCDLLGCCFLHWTLDPCTTPSKAPKARQSKPLTSVALAFLWLFHCAYVNWHPVYAITIIATALSRLWMETIGLTCDLAEFPLPRVGGVRWATCWMGTVRLERLWFPQVKCACCPCPQLPISVASLLWGRFWGAPFSFQVILCDLREKGKGWVTLAHLLLVLLTPSLPMHDTETHGHEEPGSAATVPRRGRALGCPGPWIPRSLILKLLPERQKQTPFIMAEGPVGVWISEQLPLANTSFSLNTVLCLWSPHGAQMAAYHGVAK